jgi:ribosomal protein S18 acetylase RimI-like enzyme
MREDQVVPKPTGVEVKSHAERPIDPTDVIGLYAAEGWWPERSRPELAAVLENGPAVGAWITGRLVGFGRAVTDGAFRAYVEDVVVAEDVRGAGIGRLLLDYLLEQLPPAALTSLFCSVSLTELYAGSGFHRTNQVVMHRDPPA